MSTEDLSADLYDAERTAFYDAYQAHTQNTGHKPSHLDVWLMARGVMDTNGRRSAASASAVPTGWVVEAGAVSLPHGHPSRLTTKSIHDTEAEARSVAAACGFDADVYPVYRGASVGAQAVPATDAEPFLQTR